MNPQLAFQPGGSSTNPPTCSAAVVATTSVQVLALPPTLIQNGTMLLVNQGTANVAWCYGNNTGLTMTNGVVVLANTSRVFALPGNVTQLSVIGSAAGSTFSAVVGDGQS